MTYEEFLKLFEDQDFMDKHAAPYADLKYAELNLVLDTIPTAMNDDQYQKLYSNLFKLLDSFVDMFGEKSVEYMLFANLFAAVTQSYCSKSDKVSGGI